MLRPQVPPLVQRRLAEFYVILHAKDAARVVLQNLPQVVLRSTVQWEEGLPRQRGVLRDKGHSLWGAQGAQMVQRQYVLLLYSW